MYNKLYNLRVRMNTMHVKYICISRARKGTCVQYNEPMFHHHNCCDQKWCHSNGDIVARKSSLMVECNNLIYLYLYCDANIMTYF